MRTLLLFGYYNCHSYSGSPLSQTSDHICSLRWFSFFFNLKLFFGVFSRRVMYVASLQFPTSFNQSELIIHLLQQLYIYFVCKILSKYFFFSHQLTNSVELRSSNHQLCISIKLRNNSIYDIYLSLPLAHPNFFAASTYELYQKRIFIHE